MNYNEVLIRLVAMTSPYIYDDEESFLELMRKFYHMLHELTNATNELAIDFKKHIEEFEEYKISVSDLFKELTELINNIQIEYKQYTDTAIVNLRNYVDVQDNKLSDRITQIEIGNINIYDPTTGLLSPIQIVINNLYDSSRENAISCEEYDNLELTATSYDAKEISAFDFDTNGKTLLID